MALGNPAFAWLCSLPNRRAGGVPDFSIVGEAEMHTHRAPIVTSIIERHAVCVRKQRIDLKGPRRGMRQLRTPVPFYFGPSAKGPSIATTDGGPIVVEIDEGRKPCSLQASIQSTTIPIGSKLPWELDIGSTS